MIDTKQRLLDAAEELFAERGFAETSLREITTLADANLASVNYHFGSKDALLAAVIDRRIRPVNRGRIACLDAIERGADAPTTRQLLEAYLQPGFRVMHELGEAGERFMRLIGRLNADPDHAIHELFLRQFEEVRVRYHAAFSRALPHLTENEICRRMHYVIGAMLHTFCWCTVEEVLVADANDPEAGLRSLIEFGAHGMAAPLPAPLPVTTTSP